MEGWWVSGNGKGWGKPSGGHAITLNTEWVGVAYLHRGERWRWGRGGRKKWKGGEVEVRKRWEVEEGQSLSYDRWRMESGKRGGGGEDMLVRQSSYRRIGSHLLFKDSVILKSSLSFFFIMKAGFSMRSAQFLMRRGKELYFLSLSKKKYYFSRYLHFCLSTYLWSSIFSSHYLSLLSFQPLAFL